MSKLTFRADEELITQLESLNASKSEVIREALREYFDDRDVTRSDIALDVESIDDVIDRRVDALIEKRLELRDRDVNITITVEGTPETVSASSDEIDRDGYFTESQRRSDGDDVCSRCGEAVGVDQVYCPNCGQKQSHRVFCDCGDELRTDWLFCPACGRRTPAADVLE